MSDDQINPEMFDALLNYEGDEFKQGVVACLKLLYKLHFQSEQQHNENIKRISTAIKDLQSSVTDTMDKLEAFNKKYKEIMETVKGDNTVH